MVYIFKGVIMKQFLSALLLFSLVVFAGRDATAQTVQPDIHPLDNMPLVKPKSNADDYHGAAPNEQRGEEYRKWLSASVKISVSRSSGSGTIVYYDSANNTAYVATCGHLWDNGVMSADEGKRRNLTCKVITWYHNETKLADTKVYDAKVIFYSHVGGADTALVTFQPDWVPNYFPIAPANYEYKKGFRANSCGCDGRREVARYDVEIQGIQGNDLVTRLNSPRPGRSGGGLMDDEYYIATCWGTSNYDGSGEGYFTPLKVIHTVFSKNGYDFLLKIPPGGSAARQLPIIDRNNPQTEYPKDYILLPGR
jgi:hypothetical protein